MKEIKGYVNSIETFGAVDGPGVRFIVFLQGCMMRCKYCHNPETWSIPQSPVPAGPSAGLNAEEGAGTQGREVVKKSFPADGLGALSGLAREVTPIQVVTPEEMWQQAKRYKAYWKNGGGVTVSGGEALLQAEWVTEFFRICKANGVHTTLDTSGQPFTKEEPFFSQFHELMEVTDLFLLDVKQMNDAAHKALTGHTNRNILELGEYLAANGKHMWIRHVLVPGLTTDPDGHKALRAWAENLDVIWKAAKDQNPQSQMTTAGSTDDFVVDRIEVLPYHAMGKVKYEKLRIPYVLEDTPAPSKEEIAAAEAILKVTRR